jgi:hypothetical protein
LKQRRRKKENKEFGGQGQQWVVQWVESAEQTNMTHDVCKIHFGVFILGMLASCIIPWTLLLVLRATSPAHNLV